MANGSFAFINDVIMTSLKSLHYLSHRFLFKRFLFYTYFYREKILVQVTI